MTVLQDPFLSPSDITQQGEWLMAVTQHSAIMEELSRWNAQVLFPVCSPPYNFMGNVPLRTADDFVGRKINCYNRGVQALSTFGALQFEIQTNLLHSALQNGIIDSASRPWSIGFVSNKLYEVSKYATIDIDLIIEDMFIVISKDAWKQLPDEWKKLCQDAAPKAIDRYVKCYAEADITYIPIIRAAGIEITNFPEAERAKLVEKAAGVWEKWVAEMLAKGLPGQDVLDFAKTKRDEIMAGKTQ
jgi:TRAP-type C4-dicarboxylate transport system substrate-binding protein